MTKNVADLKPAPENPRKITDEELRTLGEAMKEFGDLSGIVFNRKTGHLVGGHQRLKHLDPSWKIVSKPHQDKQGTVAVGWVETDFGRFTYREVDWPKRKEHAANLAANKISGEWDNEKLAPILEELAQLPELDLTGFTPQEANLVIEGVRDLDEDVARDDHIPRLDRAGPKVKAGDVWALGEHRLVCGDATDEIAWNLLMERKKADLYITDPPYGVSYDNSTRFAQNHQTGKRRYDRTLGPVEGDVDTGAALRALPLMFKYLRPDGSAYICCGINLGQDLVNWLREQKIHYNPYLVWRKDHHMVTWLRYHYIHELILWCGRGSLPGGNARWFGSKQELSVWDISVDARRETRLHPTQKPTKLYERAMVNSSAPGEIIMDPFAGSGTLVIAAEKHKRRAFMMEITPVFCQLIIKRWEQWTGKKAKRLA